MSKESFSALNVGGEAVLVRLTPVVPLTATSAETLDSPLSGFRTTQSGDPKSAGGFAVGEMPERVFSVIRAITEKLADSFHGISRSCKPEEITVKFGVSFAQKGGIIVASGEATQELEIELKWKTLTSTPDDGKSAPPVS